MHSVTVWIMVNLMIHQPMPAQAPYAFASLETCQHAMHVMAYDPQSVTCRQLTYAAYGNYDLPAKTPADQARSQRNAEYNLEKLQSIIRTVPPPSTR
jgi:hypothetical protein